MRDIARPIKGVPASERSGRSLAQHPGVDAKLAAELRDVLGGRAPTVTDLPNLRFTEQ
jgi:hypothetical protein